MIVIDNDIGGDDHNNGNDDDGDYGDDDDGDDDNDCVTYSKGSSLTMPALERGNELYGFFRIDSGTFLKIESLPSRIRNSTGFSGLFPENQTKCGCFYITCSW